jgi:2,4-dienoyl-CoA reductase-like NADH-dependent reductase (Old Yellow Enzyme family)
MSILFSPGKIGTMEIDNRIVRSATAEILADLDGYPLPQLSTVYQDLASGGVGLILTGHLYVHPSGKAHPGMTGIHSDEHIQPLAELVEIVHREGGKVAVQLNHGGAQCSQTEVHDAIAPSNSSSEHLKRSSREMSIGEIEMLVEAFGQAARRAKEAGFDGVQIHAAHGYLVSQFHSPLLNRRTDKWGGSLKSRMRFLSAVTEAVRQQVGENFPVFTKLGLFDGLDGGLTIEEGLQIAAAHKALGLDAIEISSGFTPLRNTGSIRTNIAKEEDEAYFRPLARQVRLVTDLPILLVGGLRSKSIMEDILETGDAQFVSLCRPLISEPDFPKRLIGGKQQRSRCISGNRCFPKGDQKGIACRCLD